MKKKNSIFMMVSVLIMVFLVTNTVYAAGGSVTIRTDSEEEVTIYKIADDSEYEEEWKDYPSDFENLSKQEEAHGLQQYAEEHQIEGLSQGKNEEGIVKFESLENGYYLIVQDEVIQPFLIMIPMVVDGKEVYDIEAFPKVELEKPDKEEPEGPEKPEGTDQPSGKDEKLPQTGQLNWPVPVLAISGLVLFAIGWSICFKKKGK